MARELRLRLLGGPVFNADGEELSIAASRAVPVFTYLACAADQVPRERLAQLLWRRVGLSSALASLRQLTHHLPEPLRAALAPGRTTLALSREAVDCDVWHVRDALARAVSAAHLLQRYAGPLLGDARFDDFPEFDDWLREERRRLAHDVHETVMRDLAVLPEAEALSLARAWLARAPSDEGVHARVIALHLGAGRTREAELHYEALRDRLATSEGRAPQPATRALLDAAARRRAAPRGTLPAIATSFVGRQDELAEMARLAADPHCRLVTLHGPGGVGKTRLAMAFAEETAGHADDVCFVSLEAAATTPAMYAAIASALALELSPRQEPRAALLGALRGFSGFLVLDNFEQLVPSGTAGPVEAATFVAELLRAAPRLKVVVTTRVRLDLQEEWVVDVPGLPYPDAASENGLHDAGVELFASRARQAWRGFSVSVERPHIVTICRAAEGLPLALELAAAQVGTRPCAEIARDLLDAAQAPRAANRPDRQASVLRVIEQSLAAATPVQAAAFEKLALFQGTFDAAQAFAVGRVGEGELRDLTGRALVARQGEGFRMHPLLRQVAERRLRKRKATARQVEAAFVAERARRCAIAGERIWGRASSHDARAAMGAQRGDDLLGLALAAAGGDEASAWSIASAVSDWSIVSGLPRPTVDAWPDPDEPGVAAGMGAILRARRGDMQRHCGRYAEAFDDYAAVEAATDDPRLRYVVHNGRAGLHIFRGDFEECLAESRAALELADVVGSEPARVRLLSQYGTALFELGRYGEARAVLGEAMARCEAMDASAALQVYPLNAMGGLEDYTGNARACADIHRRALAMLEAEGLERMQAPHWCNLGGAQLMLEDYAAALPAFERGIAIATQANDLGPLTYSQIGLGNALSGLGRHAEAERVAAEAEANARRLGSTALAAEATTVRVGAALDGGELQRARQLVLEYEDGIARRDAGFRGVESVFSMARVARALRLPAHEEPVALAVASLLASPACVGTQPARLRAWREREGLREAPPVDVDIVAAQLLALLRA